MKLTEHIYEYQFDPNTNVIDVYINKLRAKIDKGFDNQLLLYCPWSWLYDKRINKHRIV